MCNNSKCLTVSENSFQYLLKPFWNLYCWKPTNNFNNINMTEVIEWTHICRVGYLSPGHVEIHFYHNPRLLFQATL